MSAQNKSTSKSDKDIERLEDMNKQLKAENAELKTKLKTDKSKSQSILSKYWKNFVIFVMVTLAGALLVAGNILFWGGRTIVDTGRYEQTMTTLIKDTEIQKAVALYTTNQIYENYDVDSLVQSALPPRADFLAPTLSDKLKGFTQETITKLAANEKFQDAFIAVNVKAHDSLLKLANSPQGQDGVINLNEVYQTLSSNLVGTKLSVLADKRLPDKVGQITVLKSDKLHTLHVISSNINTFKYLCLGLVVLFSFLAVWLSNNRRRSVIRISLLYGVLMLVSLLAVRVLISVISSKVALEYQVAVRHAGDTLVHFYRIQTVTLLLISLLVFVGAFLGGNYRSARAIRYRSQLLLDGKIHSALFANENSFTVWIADNKRFLRISSVLAITVAALFITLSPIIVLLLGLLAGLVYAAIEVLAANNK